MSLLTALAILGLSYVQLEVYAVFSVSPNGTALQQCSQVTLSWTESVRGDVISPHRNAHLGFLLDIHSTFINYFPLDHFRMF